jgi:hypothetical protein
LSKARENRRVNSPTDNQISKKLKDFGRNVDFTKEMSYMKVIKESSSTQQKRK